MNRADAEFFALIGEGAGLLKGLDENAPGFFDSLGRLREIIAMLGEAGPSPVPEKISFTLADKEGSLKSLADYMSGGIKSLPPLIAAYEAETVVALAQTAGNPSFFAFAQNRAHDHGFPEAHLNETKLALFEELRGRGVKHGIDQNELADNITKAAALLQESLTETPEYKAARGEYDRISAERFDKIKALHQKRKDDPTAFSMDEFSLAEKAIYDEYDQAQTDAWQAVRSVETKFNEDRVARHRALFEANGKQIIAAVASASPVTQEQADAWAREQIIDDNAKAKLKRLGYNPDDLVRDMAEFYRLSGGKASAIRISTAGHRRANAVGINERLGEKVINLGSRFNKTVLFHELAHHLENDPIAKAAANGFLVKRRESDTVYRLRDLTGNSGYDRKEVAYKDSFMDPYVGKVYRDAVTEVFSMGVQYLANPGDAARFAGTDPEMYELITGYLSMPLTPAMAAKLNMHAGAIDELQEKRETEAVQYDKALALLAGSVALTADGWFDSLDPESELARVLNIYVLPKGKNGVKYVGGFGDFKVFSGVFRNKNTKRNAKGHLVVNIGGDGGRQWNIPDNEAVPGDIETAKAMIAVAKRDSASLSSVWFNYFMDSSWANKKQKLIETVGAENLK